MVIINSWGHFIFDPPPPHPQTPVLDFNII